MKNYYAKVNRDMRRKIYRKYADMIQRCYNANCGNYHRYGARGIGVCDEWRDSFDAFLDWIITTEYINDMTLSIDRINNDGDYSPDNCRMVTKRVQNINKAPNTPNTSGYVGVRKHAVTGWYGSVKINNKDYYTGWSKDVVEAAVMRNKYIIEHNLDNQLNEVAQ